jgi:UDP:flavonoid glycosyltransferase YjiC (YdhE family)
MRILCSTTPMEGVLGPFLALGRALAAGHDVVVASGADVRARAEENGLSFREAGLGAMEGAQRSFADPDVEAAPEGDRIRFPAVMFGQVIPTAKLPTLRELADDEPVDLVVHPPVDLAGPLLAAERDIPSVCYGFGQPFDPVIVAAMAERVRPLWEQSGVEADQFGGIYRDLYLDATPAALSGGDAVPALGGTRAIRPEVPGDPSSPLPAWADELADRPVVYVSLGTVPLFNQPDRFRPLLEALGGQDVEVVMTVSHLHDPAALGAFGPHVHVERWLSLASLLPRCDAVICHAGSGTTLAALTSGLPLVLLPQGADQFDNARACERAGAARVLMPDEVNAQSVSDAVRAVLAEGSERASARAVAAEIAAMPSAEAVADELTRMVHERRLARSH